MSTAGSVRQGGFSLLELLVAFSILAFSLGTLYQATGSSVRNVGDAARSQHAVLLVESLISQRYSLPQSGWNEAGQSGGFDWTARSVPYKPSMSDNDPKALKLHEVQLLVSWNDGERLREIEVWTLLPLANESGVGMP